MNNKIRISFTILLTLWVVNTHAAVYQFLLLDGIAGESQDKRYKGSIDVLAWSWNMSQSGTTHLGGGGAAGKSSFADISVTKYIDASSTVLYEHIAQGTHIDSAALKVRRVGSKPSISEEIVMYDILVTSATMGGSGGEDRLTENISLNFRTFCLRYTEQTPEGDVGGKSEICWNIGGNQSCTASQLRSLLELPIAAALPMGQLLTMNPICINT